MKRDIGPTLTNKIFRQLKIMASRNATPSLFVVFGCFCKIEFEDEILTADISAVKFKNTYN